MTKKFYFFAVMTALFLLAPTTLWAEQSGTCGDNVTWSVNDEGVLTIEGKGAMTDYNCWESPFEALSPAPQIVVIKGEVTTIGKYAFYYCTGLQSADISGSVTSIGQYAFSECVGLEEVTISSPVKSIGSHAFEKCSELTSITLPSSVTSIGDYAFSSCSGLTRIESLAENPPVCDGDNVFNKINNETCELAVPEKSINAYKTADGWKEFTKIVTGISRVSKDNNAVVSAKNGAITVTGTAGNAVMEVYSTSGVLVYRGTSKTVTVPSAGIYIVKAVGKTFKVNAAK